MKTIKNLVLILLVIKLFVKIVNNQAILQEIVWQIFVIYAEILFDLIH